MGVQVDQGYSTQNHDTGNKSRYGKWSHRLMVRFTILRIILVYNSLITREKIQQTSNG